MHVDIIYMLGLIIVFAISILLACCFTESKGENTTYARRDRKPNPQEEQTQQSKPILEDEDDALIH